MAAWKRRRDLELWQRHRAAKPCLATAWLLLMWEVWEVWGPLDSSPIYSSTLYLQPSAVLTSPSGWLQGKDPLCKSKSHHGLVRGLFWLEDGVCITDGRRRGCRRLSTEYQMSTLPLKGFQRRGLQSPTQRHVIIICVSENNCNQSYKGGRNINSLEFTYTHYYI